MMKFMIKKKQGKEYEVLLMKVINFKIAVETIKKSICVIIYLFIILDHTRLIIIIKVLFLITNLMAFCLQKYGVDLI
jgi:hypothetical protein